jgi:lipoprotein-releasing system ATP-binding protein
VPDILRLEGVRKSYAGATEPVEVLHGIDLRLVRGELVALVGPSGSGKSTLLNLIGLLDRPDSGAIFIDGRDTTSLTEAELTQLRGRAIGFVFQYHHLIAAFTAVENVMMPMLLSRGRPDEQMRAAAAALLDRVGLTPWLDQPVNRLSGGQQQRVAVARALAMQPHLVLADEPTGNLDTKSAAGVFEVLRSLGRGGTTATLLVTHNLDLAHRCDRVIELVDGRIVAAGPAAERPVPQAARPAA